MEKIVHQNTTLIYQRLKHSQAETEQKNTGMFQYILLPEFWLETILLIVKAGTQTHK